MIYEFIESRFHDYRYNTDIRGSDGQMGVVESRRSGTWRPLTWSYTSYSRRVTLTIGHGRYATSYSRTRPQIMAMLKSTSVADSPKPSAGAFTPRGEAVANLPKIAGAFVLYVTESEASQYCRSGTTLQAGIKLLETRLRGSVDLSKLRVVDTVKAKVYKVEPVTKVVEYKFADM